jgi:Uma2 family endonuclease
MPVPVTDLPVRVDPPKKRWTRADCEALSSSGLLNYENFELVEGELISTMGKSRCKTIALMFLRLWLDDVFGRLRINQGVPIDVAPEDCPTNEPVLDLIVLNRDFTQFQRNPNPADNELVVEVSDTSLYYDLTTKAALYARAGILDYWVLDVNGRRMLVHRDPRDGRYNSVVAYSMDESVAPLAAPASSFRVRDAFPTA